MADPERSLSRVAPPPPQEEITLTLDEIERRLEVADEIENVIERTQQREALLELLDAYLSDAE